MKTRMIAKLYQALQDAGFGFDELRIILQLLRGTDWKENYNPDLPLYELSIEGVIVIDSTRKYTRLTDVMYWITGDLAELHSTYQPLIEWEISPL